MTDNLTIQTKAGRVDIRCYYDDQGAGARGWFAEFRVFRAGADRPCSCDDTAKIWSVEMPVRESAERLAWQRARGYARRLLAELATR